MYRSSSSSTLSSKESLEDILVKQYKESLKAEKKKPKKDFSSIPSPYQQSIVPKSMTPQKVFLESQPLKRPMSAKPSIRKRANSIDNGMMIPSQDQKMSSIDEDSYSSEFEESSDTTDDEEEEISQANKSQTSPQKNGKLRSASAQPRSTENDSSHDYSKPIFKRKNFTIICYAYKNGFLDNAIRLVAPNIKQLLESATTKLGLNTAARRVFLSNGVEAFRPQDIPRDAEVFISKGEAYINCYKALKGKGENKPGTAPKRSRTKIKPPSSKMLNKLTAKRSLRVIVFRNGDNSQSHEMNYETPSYYSRDEKEHSTKTEPDLSMYMSEKKKQSINDEIEQKHKIAFDKFLDGCTKKLSLTNRAKCVFNWKGEVVSHIKQVEKIDFDLRTVTYGPLWVSKGEWFNPLGSLRYLQEVITDLKCQLHGAKQGKRDLESLLSGNFHQVSNPAIFSLEPQFVEPTKEKVEDDIVAIQTQLKKYKARLKKVKAMADELESRGADYVMKNIQEIDEKSRLLEKQKGLRVKMYENGSEVMAQVAYLNMRDIQRGTKDSKLIRSRFLEALTSLHKPKDPTGPARSRFIRRLFNRHGDEIADVRKIQNDDDVWVSYGEEFKPLFNGVITLAVGRATGVIVSSGDRDECKVYEDYLNTEELPENCEKSTHWRTTEGFPTQYKFANLENLHPSTKAETEKAIEKRGCATTEHFLQHKEDQSVVLRPQARIDQKTPKKSLWPSEGQIWMINQSGVIYSRAFPALALCVNYDNPISVFYKDRTVAEGFSISLKKKSTANEEWSFTPEGNICPSQKAKQLVLTFLDPSLIQQIKEQDELHGQGDAHSVSDLTSAAHFEAKPQPTLAVMDKFKGQSLKSDNQRWAMKQETYKDSCQWRQTKVANPLWRKLAYSWPVLPDGNWNGKYKWPMQGCLLPNAPSPLKRRASAEESSARLKVYKNGESDKQRFVWIVAPDLSGMEKSKQDGKNKVCAIENLIELELAMFLEQATSLLGLSSAARRLFNENGKELSSLRSLKRDKTVYVSSGDSWIDPRMTKAERQRRQLLANLTHDVTMMKAYCDVRDPKDFLIEAEKGLIAGSRLILRKYSLTKQEREKSTKDEIHEEDKISDVESDGTFPFASDLRSAHEISHQRAEKIHEAKKYTWQQELQEEMIDEEKPLKREKRTSKTKKREAASHQKFQFCDGFICPTSEPNLVLGVHGIDLDNISGNVDVVLCHKSIDDPAQRWEMTEEGFIRMKCSSKLVLGVAMPAYKPGVDEKLSFDGCLVTVQTIKEHTYGRANQKWLYDPVYQNILAFKSNLMDKEITAANHVSVCTSAVVGPEAICQDGYMLDAPSETPLIVCSACAKIARGRFQLIKSPEKLAFVCALSNGRKTGLRLKGSFSCLNGKVDLSTFEADTTLQHWASQLEKLRQETSLRSLNREIQSQTPIQACRVLAMRNGEGRLRSPELIIGTSISGILDQCTQRLALGTAARRLYTSDGMHVLHMEQLIEWAVEHYYNVQKEEQSSRGCDYERGEPEGGAVSLESHKHEESSNSREGTPDHATAEAGTKVTTADISKKVRSPSGRKTSLNKPPPSQPTRISQEVPLSVILRTPVEVWVSCGENFIRPSTAEKLYESSLKAQMNRNADNLVLETEKHALRHMQGRRYKEMSPTSLKSTTLPETPILVEGGWQETSKDEAIKLERVHKLEELLAETRPLHQPPKTKGIDLSRELYAQAVRKRVLVYQKGESPQKAAYVWGESISEMLSDATTRLSMHRRAKSLFNERGKRVTSFDSIERDSLLCVTTGDSLKGRPKHSDVKMKANWARARKECGPDVDQVNVTRRSPEFDVTNVDPFGPPLSLALEGPESED